MWKFIHDVNTGNMKKFICLFSLAGMLMILNSCTTTGYVASEPIYVEHQRPAPPSKLHIWVDGGWVYNRRTSVYVQRDGYWHNPTNGRVYISGHWLVGPRGRSWVPGHWQRRSR